MGGEIISKYCRDKEIQLKPGSGHYYLASDNNLILVRPTTFMNSSGIAVSELKESRKLRLRDILIVMDDMDLPFGQIRIKKGGSSGGHKGMESIIYHCDSENIPRLRVGIGRSVDVNETRWVLSQFNEYEKEQLTGIFKKAVKAIEIWNKDGIEIAMNKMN